MWHTAKSLILLVMIFFAVMYYTPGMYTAIHLFLKGTV